MFIVRCTLAMYYFLCRPNTGILSRLPAELEVTGSVEVTDCSTRMFITSPCPNEQPLCHAVLASLALNVKTSKKGKEVKICHILTISTMLTCYLYLPWTHFTIIVVTHSKMCDKYVVVTAKWLLGMCSLLAPVKITI